MYCVSTLKVILFFKFETQNKHNFAALETIQELSPSIASTDIHTNIIHSIQYSSHCTV